MAGLESYRVGACRIIPALPTVTMENYLSVAVSGGLANINLTTHYPCFFYQRMMIILFVVGRKRC